MRVLFWGTPAFAVPTLRALYEEGHDVVGVVTQPDRRSGRGRSLKPSPVKAFALQESFTVLQPELPRGDDFLAELRALDPEISVVVAYGHILREDVLELPRRGSWNVHASILPELRGAAPIHWAIERGFETTGVSVMRMSRGMDAGPVLHQVEVEIGSDETSTELAYRLSEIGAQAMVEALAVLEFTDTEPVEQNHEDATFAPKVSREIARIDWSRSARDVALHVRAMDDIPGPWTLWGADGLKLFRPDIAAAKEWDASAADAEPGTVLVADGGGSPALVIATGDGAIGFHEAQPPGKKRMAAADWLRGKGVEVGTRLG